MNDIIHLSKKRLEKSLENMLKDVFKRNSKKFQDQFRKHILYGSKFPQKIIISESGEKGD